MFTENHEAAQRSISVSIVLSAPVDRVWEAWTNREQIAHWWGPDGFTNTIHQMDIAAGGEWRLTMHGPDGKRYPNRSVFVEIVPFSKIVFQHFNPHYLAIVLFTPHEDETLMEWTMIFETAELFDTVVKVFKADKGLEENAAKLAHFLNQQK